MLISIFRSNRRFWLGQALCLTVALLCLLFGSGWGLSLGVYLSLAMLLSIFLPKTLSWLFLSPVLTLALSATNNGVFWVVLSAYAVILVVYGIHKFLAVMEGKRLVNVHSQQLSYVTSGQLFFSQGAFQEAKLSREEEDFVKKDLQERYQVFIELRRQDIGTWVKNYSYQLAVIQAIFRELTDSPRQILSMDDFLYRHFKDFAENVNRLVTMEAKTPKNEEQILQLAEKLGQMQATFEADFIKVTEDERQLLREL
ncbi:5-bromo-4-chloroindolyl phosphate hydrolysis family protein [Ligilactobacillus equi]|uniref:5-bromo-4-chloroindolyl phosphate hydrolysis family protein n=1 Tax=Ligilactobacillus equi DPC 6820 TaxID=1392007 RepID=V7HTR7_9LACO|nr:5-bromo-4-chloroindolyl phosphate hydrolysis family protein [Ligilactobacillus equi]ETA73302.1 5-bromo-4-chloroindolyl phosphate hydrolysis family protein [Ligilactobacillus equi DPC 6820]